MLFVASSVALLAALSRSVQGSSAVHLPRQTSGDSIVGAWNTTYFVPQWGFRPILFNFMSDGTIIESDYPGPTALNHSDPNSLVLIPSNAHGMWTASGDQYSWKYVKILYNQDLSLFGYGTTNGTTTVSSDGTSMESTIHIAFSALNGTEVFLSDGNATMSKIVA